MTSLYIHGLGQTPSVWQPVLRLMNTPANCAQPDLASMVCAKPTTYTNLYKAFAQLCDASAAPLMLCGPFAGRGACASLRRGTSRARRCPCSHCAAIQNAEAPFKDAEHSISHHACIRVPGNRIFKGAVYRAVRQYDRAGFHRRFASYHLPRLGGMRQS